MNDAHGKMVRPRPALPFTVVTGKDTVRLVAGEDVRYTLEDPGLQTWFPGLLSRMDGRTTARELVEGLPPELRPTALDLMERLCSERVLVDGSAAEAHRPMRPVALAEGTGPLLQAIGAPGNAGAGEDAVRVFCQDSLDHETALAFNQRCLAEGRPWVWASTGPVARGYVSPLFLPDAGPCLACLIGHFLRLSPAPDVHEALRAHARSGGTIVAGPFPDPGVRVLAAIVSWKLEQSRLERPPPSLFRLHVLELSSFEVTAERVLVDPWCSACQGHR